MASGAAAEQGAVRRSLLSRAPRVLARTGSTLMTAALLAAVAGPATAGLLQTRSTTLAAGAAPVSSCGDTSAALVSYDVTDGQVTAVRVTGLPAGCNDSRLGLTLTSNGTAVAHAAPVIVAGGSALLSPLTATPSYSSVTDARIALVG